MQLELIFAEPSDADGSPNVWIAFDEESKNEALEVLARLIAKVVNAEVVAGAQTVTTKERNDE